MQKITQKIEKTKSFLFLISKLWPKEGEWEFKEWSQLIVLPLEKKTYKHIY